MKLTENFIANINRDFGDDIDVDRFIRSFDESPVHGILVNALKISVDEFTDVFPVATARIPWAKEGLYVGSSAKVGKRGALEKKNNTDEADRVNGLGAHPYHYAGLYYIQEPSAMIPAIMLDAKPGESILDLCAAPGGKTIKIAMDMRGNGLLISNEINAVRVRPLVKNIERLGLENTMVLNEKPEKLKKLFPAFFDRILVDAPCSGEGMFRRNERNIKDMGRYDSESCAKIQLSLLEDASEMLKSGGRLVYSTCTFSIAENEMLISKFLDIHKDFSIVDGHNYFPVGSGISHGKNIAPYLMNGDIAHDLMKNGMTHDLTKNGMTHDLPKNSMTHDMIKRDIAHDLTKAVRIWPHLASGEGHFSVAMTKGVSTNDTLHSSAAYTDEEQFLDFDNQMLEEAFLQFENDHLIYKLCGYFFNLGNYIYSLPKPSVIKSVISSDLTIAKYGRFIGEFSRKENRVTPSHSLLLSLNKGQVKNTVHMELSDPRIERYLKGETIESEKHRSLAAISVDGYYLGWGKCSDGFIKNLYPKGWRKMR